MPPGKEINSWEYWEPRGRFGTEHNGCLGIGARGRFRLFVLRVDFFALRLAGDRLSSLHVLLNFSAQRLSQKLTKNVLRELSVQNNYYQQRKCLDENIDIPSVTKNMIMEVPQNILIFMFSVALDYNGIPFLINQNIFNGTWFTYI